LQQVVAKYSPRDLTGSVFDISQLKATLQKWASTCYSAILDSGSRAKGTAISLASDVDYLVSLTSDCNENSGGLKSIYDSLHSTLKNSYPTARPQNVSIRVTLGTILGGVQVDVTPARKQPGNTNDHWLYLSKQGTRQQTNMQRHIADVSRSGRTSEIKALKIWRELNQLDFPSVYLEYLLINHVLSGHGNDLGNNVWHVLNELAKDTSNPLFARIIDPANSTNALSDLLTTTEKQKIIAKAKVAAAQQNWNRVVW